MLQVAEEEEEEKEKKEEKNERAGRVRVRVRGGDRGLGAKQLGGARRLRRINHNAARLKTSEAGTGGVIAAPRSPCRLRSRPRSLHYGRAAVAEHGLREHGHRRGRGWYHRDEASPEIHFFTPPTKK